MNRFAMIYKRELSSFFISPIAYIVMAVFMVVTGMIFYSNVSFYAQASAMSLQDPRFGQLNLGEDFIRPLFDNICVILLFMVPALTMRLFSEEKRSGTIELLMSYPIRDTEIIMGKFVACLSFLVIMTFLTSCYPIFLYFTGDPELGPFLSASLGFFLMGSVFISIGLFASAMTENQIIAALVAFGLNLVLWIVGWTGGGQDGSITSKILEYVSIVEHYGPLAQGIINSQDIVYFLSMCALFLFLTNRVLLSRKLRG